MLAATPEKFSRPQCHQIASPLFQLLSAATARVEDRLASEPAMELQTLESAGWKHFPSAPGLGGALHAPYPATCGATSQTLITCAPHRRLAGKRIRAADTYAVDHHRDTYMWFEAIVSSNKK
jgi:hypothetical protein